MKERSGYCCVAAKFSGNFSHTAECDEENKKDIEMARRMLGLT